MDVALPSGAVTFLPFYQLSTTCARGKLSSQRTIVGRLAIAARYDLGDDMSDQGKNS